MRTTFQEKIKAYEKQQRPIIYVDESGFAKDMPRLHDYSSIGTRCYGKKDWHAKGRINVIGALLGTSLLTVCLFETNINAEIFIAWVKHDLIPKVPNGAVIVLDNASFHKCEDMKIACENAEITLEYLPPYSPDLNPIEHKWAQAKAIRRREKQTINNLFAKNNI